MEQKSFSTQRKQPGLESNEKPVVARPALLREQIYDLIRAQVLKGTLPPGYRLVEDELAEYFGVSRTPVREAIRRLEIEGMVVAAEGRGFEVASVGQEDLDDALHVRLMLEKYAARRAAEFATPEQIEELQQMTAKEQEYLRENLERHLVELSQLNWKIHELIVACARSRTMSQILEKVLSHSAYRLYALGDARNLHLFAESHLRLLDAIRRHDPDAAEAEIVYHIKLMQETFTPGQP